MREYPVSRAPRARRAVAFTARTPAFEIKAGQPSLSSRRPEDRGPRPDDGTRLDPDEIRRQDALVLRAQAGDPEGLTQLHAEHAKRVYRYFYARLDGRTELAEDLTSEVFLRMLQRLGRYECRGLPFSAWLFRIAHNLLVDHLRAEPPDSLLSLDTADEAPAPRAEQELQQVDARYDLDRALDGLTRAQRDIVELRLVVGLSIAEVAAAVGKTEEAVKKLQARGLAALRRQLLTPGTMDRGNPVG
jgi:RNA polymerase sigma-70 factor, ECF subfamily